MASLINLQRDRKRTFTPARFMQETINPLTVILDAIKHAAGNDVRRLISTQNAQGD